MVTTNTSGIIMHFDKDVNLCIKLAFKEFRKWLTRKISFPIKINVCVTSEYRVYTKNKVEATGIFGTPSAKNKYPYIKLATSDFDDLKSEIGYYNGMMSILHTFAHEIVHYKQWVNNKAFKESLADKEAIKLVEGYSDYKMGFLTANKKSLSIIKKTDNYFDREKYIQAIKYYNRISLENYDFAILFKDIGDAYSSLGNYEQAIQYYNKLIDLDEKDYDLYIKKGYALDMLSRFDEAILCYDFAITLNPEEGDAYLNKGYALHNIGEYEKAIECFNKSIVIKASKGAYIFKAYSLEKLDKYDDAFECYDRAIDLDHNYDIAYNAKGQLFCHVGKFEDALHCCNKAISIDPNYADAYYNIAVIYANLQDIENAKTYLNKAIAIDKEFKSYAMEEEILKEMI